MTAIYIAGGAALTILASLAMTWLSNAAAEEASTRMERLPQAILRLAVRYLPREQRTELLDEWDAELAFISRETPGLPITRLIRGISFAVSAAWNVKQISAPPYGISTASYAQAETSPASRTLQNNSRTKDEIRALWLARYTAARESAMEYDVVYPAKGRHIHIHVTHYPPMEPWPWEEPEP